MNAVTPLADHYVTEFDAVRNRLPGQGAPWLRRLREESLDCFREIGFPTLRHEDWKYTSLKRLEKHTFRLPTVAAVSLTRDDLRGIPLDSLECHRLVFLNGRLNTALGELGRLPEGVTVSGLAAALDASPGKLEPHLSRYADVGANGFAALNLAFAGDGAYVHLARGAVVERPIHLVFVATVSIGQDDPANNYLRNLIVADDNSQARIIESYVSVGDPVYLNNSVTETVLGANADIEHYKLQQESTNAFHISTLQIQQSRDSRFTSHSVSLGASLARNDINASLDAEGAECTLNGLYIAGGRQHVDYHTRVDHRQPHGTSKEFYKGVIADRARAVFNGRVYVHQDAQKTDAEQSNKNLLLSADAEVDTKPQLEIYADDVKCSHGATVGQLDERMLFYLRTRGIEESTARGMLTYGFAHDVIERIDVEPIRAEIEDALITRLPGAQYIDKNIRELM